MNPAFFCIFWCLNVILISVLTLFPIFIGIKVDGLVDWNWASVFSPIWIFSIIGCFASCCLVYATRKALLHVSKFLLLVLFFIFLVLRLDETIEWKWVLVFIPLYILEISNILTKIPNLRKFRFEDELQQGQRHFYFGCGYLGFIFRNIFSSIQRLTFIIFIAVRVDGYTEWSYWAVISPLLASLCCEIFLEISDNLISYRLTFEVEEKEGRRQALILEIIAIIFGVAFALTFLGLLIEKFDGRVQYSMVDVMIPIYVAFGLVYCCCFCCVPCIMCCAGAGGNYFQEPEENMEFMSEFVGRNNNLLEYSEPEKEVDEVGEVPDHDSGR